MTSCSQCRGAKWVIRKVGKDSFARPCPVCTPGSLFNQRPAAPPKKKRRRK